MSAHASVLIVDDDPELRDWLGTELNRNGYDVATAASGQAAVALLSNRPFDLALIDLRLPSRDGLETLADLRALDPDLEAIILTAYASVPAAVGSIRGGAYDFVQKPFTVRELLPRLQRAIEKSELRGLVSLHEASRALLGPRTREGVASQVLEVLRSVIAVDAVGIRYPGGSCLDPHAGELARNALSRLLVLHAGAAEAVRLQPADLAVAEADGFQSGLVLSLGDGGAPGSLALLRGDKLPTFTAAEVRRATVYAAQVALALENAALKEELEEKLREARHTQDMLIRTEKLAVTGQLAAGVAHEINNPLSYVLANMTWVATESAAVSEELARGRARAGDAEALAAASRQLLEIVEAATEAREGAERIRLIVGDLRTFARSDEQRHVPVDLHRVLEWSTHILASELRARARLERDFAEVPKVLADEPRLGQLFVNLVVNAMQAFPADDPARNVVRISMRPVGGEVEIVVADNGPGIPAELIPRIFQPFFTTKPVGVGTGLGLPICQSIAGAHGGTLEVASVPGEGARFTVRLPALPADGPSNPG